jgi:hypothetical protein
LAFKTHDHLGKARRLQHQPLEETFTDINILELKDRHPSEIYSHTFSKRKEGVNGADWEWWLTNPSRNQWLGLRVQAKVLHLQTNKFLHLHYQSGVPKTYQLNKLKAQAANDDLIPLYCFFSHAFSLDPVLHAACKTHPPTLEYYGCALTSLEHVEGLQVGGRIDDYASVMSAAVPWHCLVCCSGYGQGDLPTRALAFLRNQMSIGVSTENDAPSRMAALRREPPAHVKSVLRGEGPESIESDAQGVVILAPSAEDVPQSQERRVLRPV